MPLADTLWSIAAERERPNGHAIYARRSQNRNGQSESVAAQIEESCEFNESRGWDQNEAFIFSDDNISASEYTTKDRPDFQRLCDAIRDRRVWTVTVAEVSRITRAVPMAVDFVKLAKEAGGLIVFTTEGKQFDITTTSGEHDFYDAVVDASRESGKTSDRVKRNKKKVAREGRYQGGYTRYGRMAATKDAFGRVTNTGEAGIAVEPHQAAIINETLQRVIDGWPWRTIIRDLLERGEMWVNGKPISGPALRKALHSPHIIGARTYHGLVVKDDAYPPIAPRELWEKALAILDSGDKTGADKKGIRSYPGTGLFYCACGNKMSGHVRRLNGRTVRNYVCHLYDNTGAKVGCGKRRLADPLELLIKDMVIERLSSPEIASALKQQPEGNDNSASIQALLTEAQGISHRLSELEDAYTKGTDGLDLKTMLRLKASLETDLKAINAKVERASTRKLAGTLLTGDIREAFARADVHQTAQLMGLAIERVIILPQGSKERNRWTHEETGQSWWFNPEHIQVDWKELSTAELASALSRLLRALAI